MIDASIWPRASTTGVSTMPWSFIAWAIVIISSQVVGGASKPAAASMSAL